MKSSIIFERASVDYVNENYVTGAKMNVRRYGRKSDYYVNLEGTIKHTWGNNISFHAILYEYLHNEYKRTFVEFYFKEGCKMLDSDPYVGKAVANTGLKCPVPPGYYLLANMSIPFEDFPYVWPFERARGVGVVTCCDNVVLANVSLYLKFVQIRKNRRTVL
ncbi:hypothetical protein ABMA27_004025 [Loxostege sticticalis]|uniref:Uncharacterized protein n=1 Tax=Loxostege sticticalis TaxID=481309 RepID=A0ABR3HR77_LOXSC